MSDDPVKNRVIVPRYNGLFQHEDAWKGDCIPPKFVWFVETRGPKPDRDGMPNTDLAVIQYVRMDVLRQVLESLFGSPTEGPLKGVPTPMRFVTDEVIGHLQKWENARRGVVPSDVPEKTLPADLQGCEMCGGITDKGEADDA